MAAIAAPIPKLKKPTPSYADFLASKSQISGESGFAPIWMPDFLFDFQKSLTEWSIRKGRSALFEDCGLGKTIQQLVWAENIVRKTNRPVLILCPLAVARQTVREAEKFGIEAKVGRDGKISAKITVTNYERLHYFDQSDFSGVVCDESSILKNFDGATRAAVTEFMRHVQYRLLCTATAAPNDFIELGTSAEAIGELGRMDMLARFFKNDSKTLHLHGTKHGEFTRDRWRFKAHAETPFWRWVCSWARAIRKPSDLGFQDSAFQLPNLLMRETIVRAKRAAPGMLFEVAATTLREQREESRRTLTERCEAAASRLDNDRPAIAWCQLNDESELLAKIIPGSKQITGSDCDEVKEELFEAFVSGQLRCIVTKPKIGGLGLNFQHCAQMTFFPSHSFEQFYQGIRRCWRFGQNRDVMVDVVTTEGGAGVLDNLKRKADQAEQMFAALVATMNNSLRISRSEYGSVKSEVPSWLSSNKN